MSIAIIDYGVGNLRSVEKAFTSQGIEAIVTSDETALHSADKLVLPGVGAFKGTPGKSQDSLPELIVENAAGKERLGGEHEQGTLSFEDRSSEVPSKAKLRVHARSNANSRETPSGLLCSPVGHCFVPVHTREAGTAA